MTWNKNEDSEGETRNSAYFLVIKLIFDLNNTNFNYSNPKLMILNPEKVYLLKNLNDKSNSFYYSLIK